MSFKAPPAPPPQMKPTRPNPPGPDRDAPAPQPRAKTRKPGQMHIALKLLISLLVIWHLTAVFLAPLSIPPSSPLVVEVAQGSFMQYYLDALYLNHGYHFFAPEPSNGHLIKYQVLDSGNAIIKDGEFPSKEANWPRLLYHRYFMLADQCQVDAATEAETAQWQQDYLKAYARELLRQNEGAAAVRVQRIVHYPAHREHVLGNMPLTDPRTYEQETEVIQHRQDLDLPPPTQSNPAQSGMYQQNNWRQDVASGWQGGAR
jgi:hypothetical protein